MHHWPPIKGKMLKTKKFTITPKSFIQHTSPGSSKYTLCRIANISPQQKLFKENGVLHHFQTIDTISWTAKTCYL